MAVANLVECDFGFGGFATAPFKKKMVRIIFVISAVFSFIGALIYPSYVWTALPFVCAISQRLTVMVAIAIINQECE